MATLFISDLHLESTRPAITALFLDFLERQARRAEALYILGDLFEAWIGDDDEAEPGGTVAAALRALTDQGVPTHFLHGNRDFLLGERFAAASGIQPLPESQVIELAGERVLLLHGDTLCTDDVEYQAFRAQVRDPAWRAQTLALPLARRRALAGQLRETSRQATRQKTADITDVNPAAVDQALRAHGVRYLIHGHTHRPAIHHWSLDGQPARRAVLGDWRDHSGSVLICDRTGWRLEPLPMAGA
ncbi:MAG: UDP-2,3-diacylglucosamine diphosphatase [Candidatus Contendobacter sp.]|nr:UDP-2,3-diacylglucosamine diphosphatase [Candidatus Contendobacter sp.]MDG4556611.1 UDP-2,3-diacylglucosamine diphosphatase [Candidatus Contendobacter sp.]